MIKRAIVAALIIFFIYNLFIIIHEPGLMNYYIPSKKHTINAGPITNYQNQWQYNIIKAQRYLYDTPENQKILVGSSLSFVLNQVIPPEYVFNLSFGGGSIFEGLELIKQSGSAPPIILIETNYYSRTINKDFIHGITMPVIMTLRKHLPALRDQYQPVNTFLPLILEPYFKVYLKIKSMILKALHRFAISRDHAMAKDGRKNPPQSDGKKRFDMMLELKKAEYGKSPNIGHLNVQLNLLRGYVDYFRAKHVAIVFFEMPVDDSLYSLPLINVMRDKLQKKFPVDQYDYILPPLHLNAQTSDGIHLDIDSAREYSKFLLDELNTIVKKRRAKKSL